MKLRVSLDPGAETPVRAHAEDAGLDLKTPYSFEIPARGHASVDTGVRVEVPRNHAGLVMAKSGLNRYSGLTCEGVIDCGYTGSIVVKIYNSHDTAYSFNKGDKIAQLLIVPVITPEIVLVDEISGTGDRGDNGFGSTGK